MVKKKASIENEFGKFFFTPSYIKLKNYLFNYQFRRKMIRKYFFQYLSDEVGRKDFLIADIGSGISPVTPLPKKTLFIELEREAVDFLKRQKMKALKGDITHLNLKKESIDVVLCSEVLEHVKNYKKGLKEIERVLKKPGIVIITVPIHEYYWKDDDEFVGHFRRFNPSILQRDLEEAGLKIIVRKPIGSNLERHLTWLVVKLARKNNSNNFKISSLKLGLFKMVNLILLQLITLSNFFTSEKSSSIILFVAEKN